MTEPKKRKAINRTKGAGKVTKRPRAVRNVTLQSGNEPLHAAQATDASPLLVLRIAYASLGAESTTSDTVGRDMIPSATLYLDVLSGRVEDLDLYAATCGGASWLQVVAHNIFDPLGQRGELWTHAEGTSTDWCARLRNDTEWSAVTAGAGLKPSVYEYVMPAGVEVYMPKVCVRKSSSATSKNSESREQAARFREAVAQRDSCCIVTQISEDELPLKATRIIPRRLQSQVSAITQRYVHTSEKGIVDRYDSRIGCLLNSCVNTLFGSFTAGLFRDPSNSTNVYTMHVFKDPRRVRNQYTVDFIGHGSSITYEGSLPNTPGPTNPSSHSSRVTVAEGQTSYPHTPPDFSPSGPDPAQVQTNTISVDHRDPNPAQGSDSSPLASLSSSFSVSGQVSVIQEHRGTLIGDEGNHLARLGQPVQAEVDTDGDDEKEGSDEGEELEERDDGDEQEDDEEEGDEEMTEDDDSSDYQEYDELPSRFPPAGVFAWHYVQCVLQRFGSRELGQLPDLQFREKPSRYRDDSDEESDLAATSQELPYPSYGLETFVAMNALKREVGAWSADVTM